MSFSWDAAALIGLIAGILTTLAFLPQALKVWRTRQTRDLSLAMMLIFNSGVVLWLLYGVLIGAWPVIIANVATLALSGWILAMKLAWRKNEALKQADR